MIDTLPEKQQARLYSKDLLVLVEYIYGDPTNPKKARVQLRTNGNATNPNFEFRAYLQEPEKSKEFSLFSEAHAFIQSEMDLYLSTLTAERSADEGWHPVILTLPPQRKTENISRHPILGAERLWVYVSGGRMAYVASWTHDSEDTPAKRYSRRVPAKDFASRMGVYHSRKDETPVTNPVFKLPMFWGQHDPLTPYQQAEYDKGYTLEAYEDAVWERIEALRNELQNQLLNLTNQKDSIFSRT